MQRTFRPLFWLVLLSLLLTSLAGCASPAATDAPGAGDATQPAGEEPAGEPVTVRVLAMQQAGATPEEMNEIVAKFNEASPDVTVEIEYVSYDALHDKIVTAMAANPPSYDVILVDDIWYAEFATNGYLWDVTDKVASMKGKVFDSAWDITTVNGVTYGMPWLLDAKYFYYNTELLAQAGFDAPPTTWEELVEQSQAIKDAGIVEYPIVWSWGQMEAVICDFVTLLFGNGGTLVDETGAPTFNNEQGVEVLQWMVDTIENGISNPASISYGEEDVRNVFSQGKAVFATNWLYMYDLAANVPEESTINGKVAMSLMPSFADGGVESATINGSMGFSVVDKSPNREAAWEYVEFLTSEDIQKQYSAHVLPVWQGNYEGEALTALQGLNASNPVTVPMFSEQFPFAHVRPKVPYYPEGSKALQLAIQQALTGQSTPQEALDTAAATWVELAK